MTLAGVASPPGRPPSTEIGQPIRRGRPQKDEARLTDAALIDAAFALLTRKSHVDLTIGEVAKVAGTQPSMVRYYFGDKDGLLLAVSDVLALHTERRMAEVEKALDSRDGAAGPILRALIDIYYNPPFCDAGTIMVIEALRPGSSLIRHFRSRTAKKAVVRMMRMVGGCVAVGRYRHDLDIPSAVLSILSLATGPMTCVPMFDGSQMGSIFNREDWTRQASLMLDHAFTQPTPPDR